MTSSATLRLPVGALAILGLLCTFDSPVTGAATGPAGSVFQDSFDGPEPSWQQGASDGRFVLDSQRRSTDSPRSGPACEQISIRASNASYVHFALGVPTAPVIAELSPSVWLRSDRAGAQLLVRAVLPRTVDRQTGKPLSVLLGGTGYTQAGIWQQLKVEDLPRALERQVRVLRAQHGPQVDGREAFIDQVVLNVYGGPGATNVWIDDLTIAGMLASTGANKPAFGPTTTTPDAADPTTSEPLAATFGSVQNNGGALTVGDRPFCPRLIEYRGEPLGSLAALGFNGVFLREAPNEQLLGEARSAGLWLVCPPPAMEMLTEADSAAAGRWTPVLCWNLGTAGSAADWRQSAQALRKADSLRRPIIGEPESQVRAASRFVDFLLARRRPLGTSLELTDYAHWLRTRPQLARPGTPLWATIQSQPAESLAEQLSLAGWQQPPALQFDQIRMLTFIALTAGARGLCFESSRPLDTSDERRAAQLELLNIELGAIDAWAAGGSFVTHAAALDENLSAAVVQTERSRLVIPLAMAPHGQIVLGDTETPAASYTVPGVPEATDAYELTPAGIRPLIHKRVAGGIRITLSESDPLSLIVLTDDPAIVHHVSRRLTKTKVRAVDLLTAITKDELLATAALQERLKLIGKGMPTGATALANAKGAMTEAEAHRTEGDFSAAWLATRRALRHTRKLMAENWRLAAGAPLPAPLAAAARPPGGLGLFPGKPGSQPRTTQQLRELVSGSPFLMSSQTAAEHLRLKTALAARSWSNRLVGGEFEDLPRMTAAGWRHRQSSSSELQSLVELSPQSPHGGRYALHLAVESNKDEPPQQVEAAPLWISSAPVAVAAGQWFVVRGWTRAPRPLAGSVDGLMVIDSLGGEALAARIAPSPDWQPFELWRIGDGKRPASVSLVMSGLGEVWVDDLTISVSDESPPAVAAGPRRAQDPRQN